MPEGSLRLHRRSESWAVEAERHTNAGEDLLARGAYVLAASWEMQAFEAIPAGKPRTRGIIGRSAYWLLLKSGQAENAAAWKARMVADETFPAWALAEMEQ